jgi:small nuclear ribonucleoprotein (snRNP)-like protein
MELQLTRRDQQTLAGFLQVILPDPDRSYLSGELTVRTNYLRYVKDRVDLTWDHPDTLEYVGRQYLETQFPENTIRQLKFRDTRLLMSESGGVSTATVELVNGRIEQRRLQFDRADIGWAVRPGAMQVTVLQEAGDNTLRLVQPGATASRSQTVVEVPPPVTMAFADLESLNGRSVKIFQRDGRVREGVLRGIRRNRLMVESIVEGGTVELSFAETDLSHLVLASGQQVLLSGVEPAESLPAAQPVTPEAAPIAEPEAEQAQPESALKVDDSSLYTQLQGKLVTITSRDTRTRTGVLTAVTDRELTLTVRVGAGNLEYFYAPADIVSIKEAGR